MSKVKFKHYIEHCFYLFIVAINSCLPWGWIEWNARRVGDILYLFLFKRRRIAMQNLSRAYPDMEIRHKKRILRLSLHNIVKSGMEIILVKRILRNLDSSFKFTGSEHPQAATQAGKNIIYIVSHLGAWEYLSMHCLKFGIPTNVLVKNLRNPIVNAKLNNLRSKMKVTSLTKDDPAIAKKLFQKLRANESVALLIDQWAGPEGIWTPFFGEETSTTSMPFRLAKKTGAVLIPAFCIRVGLKSYEIIYDRPISTDQSELNATVEANKRLEAMIRKYPEQWNWLHRRWKPKPQRLRIPDQNQKFLQNS